MLLRKQGDRRETNLATILAGIALWLLSSSVWALAPTAAQSETIESMIATLEERHYAGKRYDDQLSAQHLNAYMDSLDPQRMFYLGNDT